MKNGGVLIWVILLVALLVVGAQFNHFRNAAKRQSRTDSKAVCSNPASQGAQHVKKSTVTVFGHEYSEGQVREWFAKVSGRYGYQNGTIYALGTRPGKAFTYEEFVRALKQGHYFPELAGQGVKSDGEQIVLRSEGFRRSKTTGGVRVYQPN